MKNYSRLNFLTIIFVLLISVLACANIDKQKQTTSNNATTSPTTSTSNVATPNQINKTQTTQTESTIKWGDYDKVYNIKSNSTDLQKESLWKNFEGKHVTWQGTVAEVSEGMLGGLTLNIKMNPDTLTHDITLTVKENQKETLVALTKGKKVTFTGKLVNYGGAILPLTMDEGEIK